MEGKLDWYLKARFGLFIHWGAYAAGGVEASWPVMAPKLSEAMFRVPSDITEKEYVKLPMKFNPTGFDPDEWVENARSAGMRYIVITAKHHDGFCMFDAPGTEYKITNTTYGKDICMQLAQACEKASMPLGFYYSPPDMHHHGYRDTSRPVSKNWTGEPKRKEWGEYLDYMETHIVKLLSDYGSVCLLWFDGLANHGKYNPARFHSLINRLSPDTLVNDRLGEGYDFVTPEQFIPANGIPAKSKTLPSGMDPGGDFFFKSVNFLFKIPVIKGIIRKQVDKYNDGELELTAIHQEPYPSPDRFQPWETCMTVGSTWAYNPDETDWKSPSELIKLLTGVVSKGGNLLLNAGPGPDGKFQPEIYDRWNHIGEWINRHRASVYDSTYTPLAPGKWGCAARSGSAVYIFVSEWPSNGILDVPSFPGKLNGILIPGSGPCEYSLKDGKLSIILPDHPVDPDVTVLTVDISGSEDSWENYSDPVDERVPEKKYIANKAAACGWINALANGLIAFFSYRSLKGFSFSDAAADSLIASAIIAFITAWLLTDSVRKDVFKRIIKPGKRSGLPGRIRPLNPLIRALPVALLTSIVIGGITAGALYLFAPEGIGNWAYIGIKTIYAGAAGAFAAAAAAMNVFREKKKDAG